MCENNRHLNFTKLKQKSWGNNRMEFFNFLSWLRLANPSEKEKWWVGFLVVVEASFGYSSADSILKRGKCFDAAGEEWIRARITIAHNLHWMHSSFTNCVVMDTLVILNSPLVMASGNLLGNCCRFNGERIDSRQMCVILNANGNKTKVLTIEKNSKKILTWLSTKINRSTKILSTVESAQI